jgi:antitoxin component YwqK of YwqJK toxin-antitoxin module
MIRSLRKAKGIGGVLAAALLSGCGGAETREEFYPDGARKGVTFYLRGPDSVLYRQGVHFTWYADGKRESMEIYERGYRQGYALRWHPNGRLNALEHWAEGRRDGDARFWDETGRLLACSTPEGEDCRLAERERGR